MTLLADDHCHALTVCLEPCEDDLLAVGLTIRLAWLTTSTDIGNRLEASAHADLEALHSFSDLDNDAGAFVSGTSGAEIRHRGKAPICLHEVDI